MPLSINSINPYNTIQADQPVVTSVEELRALVSNIKNEVLRNANVRSAVAGLDRLEKKSLVFPGDQNDYKAGVEAVIQLLPDDLPAKTILTSAVNNCYRSFAHIDFGPFHEQVKIAHLSLKSLFE